LLYSPPGRAPLTTAPALDLFQAEPEIRVLLRTLKPSESLTSGDADQTLSAAGSAATLPAKSVLTWNGQQLVWGSVALRLPARVHAAATQRIELSDGSWPGELELLQEGQQLQAILHIPLENYLAGVVQAEMGPAFADAALEAQAIASRSYAAHQMASHRSRAFDVDTTQLTQVLRGDRLAGRKVRRAVELTRGLVLSFEGRVLEGVFSATCGGHTRSSGEAFGGHTPAPLAGTQCGHCRAAPFYEWTASRERNEVASALGCGDIDGIGGLSFTAGERLASVVVHTASGPISISGSRMKRALGPSARSTWITQLEMDGTQVRAIGRGFGHGVGLCQHGAGQLARRSGWSVEAILSHYYPGARLARLYVP
jgi:stage II sporulation protein D